MKFYILEMHILVEKDEAESVSDDLAAHAEMSALNVSGWVTREPTAEERERWDLDNLEAE